MKKIAAITMARNDNFFLNRWISYYGKELGEENLYIYLDGLEQDLPEKAGVSKIKKLPHKEQPRHIGDKTRIALLSDLAGDLFNQGYDIVIGCDADEFLIADPKTNKSLREYLSGLNGTTSVSGLGLDVGQHLDTEKTLNPNKPFLGQRGFAYLSTRYTKPVVLFKPARWGSGFHSIKGHNFTIDKNLYLLHFGSIDLEMIKSKINGRDADWEKHLTRRAETIYIITAANIKEESILKTARALQTFVRPIYALNKPAMFGIKYVSKIPERFKKTGI